MGMWKEVVLVVVLCCIAVTSGKPHAGVTTIHTNDANWYFTEYNWFRPNASFARSANPGAYFKVGFRGSTQAQLAITPSALTSPYMNLRWSVDGKPYQQLTLATNSSSIILAHSLQVNANHSIILYIMNSLQSQDRWLGPKCSLTINGLILDAGAVTIPYPYRRSKRLMVFWDSIGEGVLADNGGGTDLTDNDSTDTSLMALAAALQAEISVVAWGRQGYTVPGNGNVAPVFTLGNDSNSAWDHYDSQHSRLVNGRLVPAPDYIFCGHGTNDQGANPTLLTKTVVGWMYAQRAAAPTSWIFVTIPYGGFQGAAISAAVTLYKQQNPTDTKLVLLNLGIEAEEGILGLGSPTALGTDGLHPTAARDGQLGAMLAAAAVTILTTKG